MGEKEHGDEDDIYLRKLRLQGVVDAAAIDGGV